MNVAARASPSQLQVARDVARQEFGRRLRPDPASDPDLIERSLRGDMRAFELLVARYERQAFWIAFHVLGRAEDARDVVQEAFVRVFRSLDRFDFGRSFYTWLYRIVTNLAIDSQRRRRNRDAMPLEDPGALTDADDGTEPLQRLQHEERAALVRRIVAELPEMFRTILVLRDLDGLSCREIAPITGLTYATVRWRLHRARELFRERWERAARRSGDSRSR